MQVMRINKFKPQVRREIDEMLIEAGFCGYDDLAEKLTRQGYRISKSSLHRYGMRLEAQIKAAKARKIEIDAGITREEELCSGNGRTTIIVMDKHNGKARMIETEVALHKVVAHLKELGVA